MKREQAFRLILSLAVTIFALTISAAAADITAQSNSQSTTTSDYDKAVLSTPAPSRISLGEIYAQLLFGQEVRAQDGATYWESADLAGSGDHGTSNNIYTEKLYIAGFAYVDDTSKLIDYECYWRDDVPVGSLAPEFLVNCTSDGQLFIATYTNGFTTGSVGWFNAGDLEWTLGSLEYCEQPIEDPNQPDVKIPDTEDSNQSNSLDEVDIYYYDPQLRDLGEQTTPQEVAKAIEKDSTEGEKIALVLDASGSVYYYSQAIASYALQVNNAECIITFAGSALEIEAEEYGTVDFGFYGNYGTDIFNALNALPDGPFDNVVLVTDTDDNSYFTVLTARDNIDAITILNPTSYDRQDVLDTIEEKWGITPRISRLNEDGEAE